MNYDFEAKVTRWNNESAGWYYVNVPTEYYDELMEFAGMHKRGFRSLRVNVEVGSSKWQTSIFPDKSSKTFLLFLKKEIRKKENIEISDRVKVELKLRDIN